MKTEDKAPIWLSTLSAFCLTMLGVSFILEGNDAVAFLGAIVVIIFGMCIFPSCFRAGKKHGWNARPPFNDEK